MYMDSPVLFQRLEGALMFLVALTLYFWFDFPGYIFFVLLFVFDLSMLGYFVDNRVGALLYNLGHSLVWPLGLFWYSVFFDNGVAFALALIWLAHIGMDRAFGFGLKCSTGFNDTHLGPIGGKK
ncbi:DUF4260 family protein [Candidatus Kaiserbacteria bacterium]|nr:DUF4260 family protein [Candidatus Kaiserbacteria bacterium]